MATKDSLHLKRVIRAAGWSISVALLFVAVEMAFEPGWEAVSIIRSATNGALFGAIFGGVHQKFITRWTQGALIWWIAAETGMISSKPSMLAATITSYVGFGCRLCVCRSFLGNLLWK